MSSINKVILIGNLGKDVDYKTLQNGSVATFTLATSRKSKTGQVDTQWHSVVCWNNLADVASKYLHKGSKVYVEGEINYRSYQDQSGANHNVTEIRCATMQMLDKLQPVQQPEEFIPFVPQSQPVQQQQPVQQPAQPAQTLKRPAKAAVSQPAQHWGNQPPQPAKNSAFDADPFNSIGGVPNIDDFPNI